MYKLIPPLRELEAQGRRAQLVEPDKLFATASYELDRIKIFLEEFLKNLAPAKG
jgi:hypothetical protein